MQALMGNAYCDKLTGSTLGKKISYLLIPVEWEFILGEIRNNKELLIVSNIRKVIYLVPYFSSFSILKFKINWMLITTFSSGGPK